jgi:hypothetical protein
MRNLLALIASVGLVGCVGSVDPPIFDDGNDNGDNPAMADLTEAKRLFDSNVYGTINASCTGTACHSEDAQGSTLTRFVAKDPAKGWETAVNYTGLVANFTTAAPILGKIEAGTHYGKSYTQEQKDKIVEWLAKEVELRNGQPNQPQTPGGETLSQAAERVMSAFAGCMTIENFTAANMGPAWANINSNEGQCKRCHANGESMFIANQDNATAFSIISTRKMFWLQYFTVDLTGGAALAKVIPNQYSFQGVYNRQPPHVGHPTFTHPNNAGMQALTTFYNSTTAALGTGCAPKVLQNQ